MPANPASPRRPAGNIPIMHWTPERQAQLRSALEYCEPPTRQYVDAAVRTHAGLMRAAKAVLGIDNPPAGHPGHVDYAAAISMLRAAVTLAELRREGGSNAR